MSARPKCPEYRLRLFLSVDLVGSTAYKNGIGRARKENNTSPHWVYDIRAFYRNFPRILDDAFAQSSNGQTCKDGAPYAPPRLWKTIGDEILFCSRVADLEHLALSVSAFMRSLEEYGEQLNVAGSLDVQGSAWTAAFPSPNVTVAITAQSDLDHDIYDEELELAADCRPNLFDFLGKEIDSGFRISKHSSSDKLAMSATLAYLLSQAKCDDIFNARFEYHGRDSLKGVIDGRPYPIVTIDMERNARRKEILSYERAVLNTGEIGTYNLRNFLKLLISDENMEFPYLYCKKVSGYSLELPEIQSYSDFKRAWAANLEESKRRSEGEEKAGDASDGDDGDTGNLNASDSLLEAAANNSSSTSGSSLES